MNGYMHKPWCDGKCLIVPPECNPKKEEAMTGFSIDERLTAYLREHPKVKHVKWIRDFRKCLPDRLYEDVSVVTPQFVEPFFNRQRSRSTRSDGKPAKGTIKGEIYFIRALFGKHLDLKRYYRLMSDDDKPKEHPQRKSHQEFVHEEVVYHLERAMGLLKGGSRNDS